MADQNNNLSLIYFCASINSHQLHYTYMNQISSYPVDRLAYFY